MRAPTPGLGVDGRRRPAPVPAAEEEEAEAFQSFRHNATYLMARKVLGASEALMAVAG